MPSIETHEALDKFERWQRVFEMHDASFSHVEPPTAGERNWLRTEINTCVGFR
jgi:hypothetical protein